MRLLRASVLFCFVDASSIKCTQNDLQTIAEMDFSKVISYPIPGDCIELLTKYMGIVSASVCQDCTQDDLSSNACKFCYARSASYAVGESVYFFNIAITDSMCNSTETFAFGSDSCWDTASSLGDCPVSVSRAQFGVSETCSSCARKAFMDRAEDCKTACGKDMNVEANKAICKSCSEAQYVSAALFCLTRSEAPSTTTSEPSSSTTTATKCTENDLQAIANYHVPTISEYPIPGDCIEALNTTLLNFVSANCQACMEYYLSSDACKFCYAQSATMGVAAEASALTITNSPCTSAEMAVISTDPCWTTASSLGDCPVSVSSVRETCLSCARKAFMDRAGDCTTLCDKAAKDDPDKVSYALCNGCSQAQHLASATYCLTVSSTETSSSFGGPIISPLLMVVTIVFGLSL